jgi:hypothetical protein
MFTFLDALYVRQMSTKLIPLLFITLVDGLLLFTIVSIITRRLRAAPAQYKHLIWFFVICCFLLIPLMSNIIPSFDLLHQRIYMQKVLEYGRAEIEHLIPESLNPETGNPSTQALSTGMQGVNTQGTISTIRWHVIALAL